MSKTITYNKDLSSSEYGQQDSISIPLLTISIQKDYTFINENVKEHHEMELQKGRPENTDNRLDKEIRVYDFLDKLGIQYQRIDHEATMTMEACEEIDRALGDNTTICKNLFLCNRQETDFYLLLMPGDKPFKTKDLSAQIHSARLSFAKSEYMEKYLDITPGSVSVLGLMNDSEKKVQLLIDEDVMKEPYFGCHPCINTSSLKFTTEDLMQKIIPALEHEPVTVTLPVPE
mgnify:FL=1